MGADKKPRCHWCSATSEYIEYHDQEWGFPIKDDQQLFEKLTLESFQSGLSWRTILGKRDNFRAAFVNFDFNQIALFTEQDRDRLLLDAGIVRHRGKIEATINNAQRALEMIKNHGSLASFFWRYAPDKLAEAPSQASSTEQSIALSKDLKKLGWKFFGPTTAYAFMQAAGMVNDHSDGCCIRTKAVQAARSLTRPT